MTELKPRPFRHRDGTFRKDNADEFECTGCKRTVSADFGGGPSRADPDGTLCDDCWCLANDRLKAYLKHKKDRLQALPKVKCSIPSYTIGSCELPWGHGGEMHANSAGDGFYVGDGSNKVHHRRQYLRKRFKG